MHVRTKQNKTKEHHKTTLWNKNSADPVARELKTEI